ncbi:hypothetical protein [Gilliamella sp. App4-10]|uniref:hypothetical protein n=1 Tax=Gilliamella sp. App4-10 TaxID=3120231 RepID=UPI00080E8FD0|nr:hypothetical protein [Gilliamella apicola]OCG19524.1 hypothetical protein A9G23_09140 [Gilliamella apicola]
MKNIILKILLLILLSQVVYASDFDSNNNYYRLINEKLTPETDKNIKKSLSNLIIDNQQKITFLGCDFKELTGSEDDINNELNKHNFLKNYSDELKEYHLTTTNFAKIYTNDRDSLSEICNRNDYMNIIQLANNELMVTYKKQLVFYQRLPEQEEKNLNNYYSNTKCIALEQVDMSYTDICYYNNMTILDVYNAMSFDLDKVFRKKINVGENFSVTYEDRDVDIDYKWYGKNKLEFTQYFQGGITTYTFIYQNGKTKLITVLSLD